MKNPKIVTSDNRDVYEVKKYWHYEISLSKDCIYQKLGHLVIRIVDAKKAAEDLKRVLKKLKEEDEHKMR